MSKTKTNFRTGLIFTVLMSLSLLVGCRGSSSDKTMDDFITRLMSEMTLEEKLGQMNLASVPRSGISTGNEQSENVMEDIRKGRVGSVLNTYGYDNIMTLQKIAVEESRLGIPLLFGLDVIHGHKTIFPIPLGLASSWNPELVENASRLAAVEASADGINWTYNPMVDIARDPRWGRCAEGFGEDPYLSGVYAAAMVRGYQGNPGEEYSDDTKMLACVKHFAAYGASESGRDYREVDMSPSRMYNEYFPPYKAAVDAGVASIMTSFNDFNGIPSTANRWLFTEVLRNQWGFDGFVVADYNAVGELVKHGLAKDKEDAAIMSVNAGLDMDMVTAGVMLLENAIREGRVDMKRIDESCRRVLEAKYRLGLFENPYKFIDKERASERVFTAENRESAKNAAAETFVLLKNSGQTLPLKKKGVVALVGPLSDIGAQYTGCWVPTANPEYPSMLDAFKKIEGIKVIHAKGSNVLDDPSLEVAASYVRPHRPDPRSEAAMIKEAVETARKADVVVAAVGELAYMTGESGCRTDIGLPQCQKNLLAALKATGKPVVMVLFSGRPMTIAWEDRMMDAILHTWFGGSEAGEAIAEVLFGDKVPSGKITMTFPYTVGQIPVYYNMKKTGRDVKPGTKTFKRYNSSWMDAPNEPLYPFGYGLSYTEFEYSAPVLSDTLMISDGRVKVSVDVKNTGKYEADEVVQLYICDKVSSQTRPAKELKAFSKVRIKPGETRTVAFELTPEMLAWYYIDQYNLEGSAKPLSATLSLEPGDFLIMTGPDSRRTKSVKLTVK